MKKLVQKKRFAVRFKRFALCPVIAFNLKQRFLLEKKEVSTKVLMWRPTFARPNKGFGIFPGLLATAV